MNPSENLCQSHYLPKGVYRLLRDQESPNPNPVLLTERLAVPTSKQLTAYLLCGKCEKRLSDNGENWVLQHCPRRGSFKLAAALDTESPSEVSSDTRIYLAGGVRQVDAAALTYFATSIFWRGSIHPWNEDGSIPIKLGPFAENFRRYLMGEETFPKYAALWVAVREKSEVERLTFAPVGGRTGNFHTHRFPMPGFGFMLFTGKNIPDNVKRACFVRGSGNPLLRTSLFEQPLLEQALAMARQHGYSSR
jgi:hypothetical protein